MQASLGTGGAVELRAPALGGAGRVLTPEALGFVAELERRFGGLRRELLARRERLQVGLDAGGLPDFLPETRTVRDAPWQVAPVPPQLQDRRVELTGPPDARRIIHALNSGASVFMADFEDATCPTFANLVNGQANLSAAVRRTLRVEGGDKPLSLAAQTAHLFVRPRGLHLPEAHVIVDGREATGAFFDFGLFLFHNAHEQLRRGAGPWFYLPKLEHHLEARLWNDVFAWSEERLGLPRACIKATVLVETLPAAFQMHELLWELRERSAGLNCGRWDYIFSYVKRLRAHADRVLPDRDALTMAGGFLKPYAELLIQTCHARGAHAMGGMAAFIPVKSDPARNDAALAKVREDKLREVQAGHDGTWVAHPALVPLARQVFDTHMPTPNQLHVRRDDVAVTREALLQAPTGPHTRAGLVHNVRVCLLYLESFLSGVGCLPIDDLMEDAATAEISRAQVWQQLHHGAVLEGLGPLTPRAFKMVMEEVLADLGETTGDPRLSGTQFPTAAALVTKLTLAPTLEEFLTVPAYRAVLERER
jgi:malate synthase